MSFSLFPPYTNESLAIRYPPMLLQPHALAVLKLMIGVKFLIK